jgi:uncharacterized membrane protein
VYNFCDKGVNYQIISNLIEHTDRHDQIYVDKRSYVWQVRLLKSEIIVNWDQQYTLNRSLIHSHGFILYNCRSKSLVGVLWAWSTFVNVLWLISVLLKLLPIDIRRVITALVFSSFFTGQTVTKANKEDNL